MNTNEIATIVAMLVNTVGNGLTKMQPLAQDVVRQYQIRGAYSGICWVLAAIALFLFNAWFYHHQPVCISNTTSNSDKNNMENTRCFVCIALFLATILLFLIAGASFMDYIAPLPQMMRLK